MGQESQLGRMGRQSVRDEVDRRARTQEMDETDR